MAYEAPLPVCPPEFHLAEFLKKFVPFHGFNDVARSSSLVGVPRPDDSGWLKRTTKV